MSHKWEKKYLPNTTLEWRWRQCAENQPSIWTTKDTRRTRKDTWETCLELLGESDLSYLLWSTHYEWICDLSGGSSSSSLSFGLQFRQKNQPCSERPVASTFFRNANKKLLFWLPHIVTVVRKAFQLGGQHTFFFLHVSASVFLPSAMTWWMQITNLLFHKIATSWEEGLL